MKRIYYFAYGSNLFQDRLEARVGNVVSVRAYRLDNYELVFNCGGFANVQPCEGDFVEGWLYELTPVQLGYLDKYEGFYYKEFFDIDRDILGVVYVGMPDIVERSSYTNTKTSLEYFNIVLTGMFEKELMASCHKLLELKDQIIAPKKLGKIKNKHQSVFSTRRAKRRGR